MKKPAKQPAKNLYLIGGMLGLSVLLSEQLVGLLIPATLYAQFFNAEPTALSLFIIKHLNLLVVLLPLTILWRSIFREWGIGRPGLNATVSIILTHLLVALPIAVLPSSWFIRAVLFVATGAVTLSLIMRVFGKTKNEARAWLTAIALCALLSIFLYIITNYLVYNRSLIFGF